METRNQIKRTLGKVQAVAHIRSVLDGDEIMNRTRLADQLCETFEFFDARGRPQRSGCLKALRQMEKSGLIVLPAPLH